MAKKLSRKFPVTHVLGVITIAIVAIAGFIATNDDLRDRIAFASNPPSVTKMIGGDIYVNGAKFFPSGFYHTSWAGNNSQRLNALRAIGAAGFNTMYASIASTDIAFLDEADRLGVKIIVEFNDPNINDFQVIEKLKNHPAIFAWLVSDDADSGCQNGFDKCRNNPATLEARNAQIKKLDPNHLTYLSCGYAKSCKNYTKAADIVGIQTYPVPDEEISGTTYMFNELKTNFGGSYPKPIIGNMQGFAWEGKRVPTPKEFRNMTYQGLIHGVKGLGWYTYFDEVFDMSKQPALWKEATAVSAEIKQLMPVLLDSTPTKLNTGEYYILAGQWSLRGETYIVIANMASNKRNLNLTVPSGNLTNLFSTRPNHLSISGGKLTGSMDPQEVYVYKIGGSTTPTPTATATPTPTSKPTTTPTPTTKPTSTPTPTPTPATTTNSMPRIYNRSIKAGRVNRTFKADMNAFDNDVSDTMTMTIQNLPPGVNFGNCVNSVTTPNIVGQKFARTQCYFSGTPTQTGKFTVILTVTDSRGGMSTKNYTMTVNE